jgi:hypothetical protein
MTPEHEEYLRRMLSPTWYGEQDENGVDLSLIRENLKLTPLERLRKADRGARDALRIRKLMQHGPVARKESP